MVDRLIVRYCRYTDRTYARTTYVGVLCMSVLVVWWRQHLPEVGLLVSKTLAFSEFELHVCLFHRELSHDPFCLVVENMTFLFNQWDSDGWNLAPATLPETHSTWNTVVARSICSWEGLLAGGMLVTGSVGCKKTHLHHQRNDQPQAVHEWNLITCWRVEGFSHYLSTNITVMLKRWNLLMGTIDSAEDS